MEVELENDQVMRNVKRFLYNSQLSRVFAAVHNVIIKSRPL